MDGRDYGILGLRLLLAFVLFFSTRVLFALFNWDYYSSCSLFEMGQALFYGLRFDIATVLIVNAIFIIFSLIPIQHKIYFWFKRLLFIVSNLSFLIINIVDMIEDISYQIDTFEEIESTIQRINNSGDIKKVTYPKYIEKLFDLPLGNGGKQRAEIIKEFLREELENY